MSRKPNGHWVRFKLPQLSLVDRGQIDGFGQFGVVQRRVLGWSKVPHIMRELPSKRCRSPRALHQGLHDSWGNRPHFNSTQDGQSTRGVLDRDLALFPIPSTQMYPILMEASGEFAGLPHFTTDNSCPKGPTTLDGPVVSSSGLF